MSDSPGRKKAKRARPARAAGKKAGKKTGKKKRPAGRRASPKAAGEALPSGGLWEAPSSGQPIFAPAELDLRTLVLLSMGDWSELADLEWPPANIRRWLKKADLRKVRGILLTTLHRWHELRRDS